MPLKKDSLSYNGVMNAIDAELMSRFDQIAGSYDAERCKSYSGVFFNELEARVIEDWAVGGRDSQGLDIPCGTGRLTASLAHLCEKVIAADISTNMLDIAREKVNHLGFTNITFLRVNSRKLSFSENAFDTIICFNFLHLIPNDQKDEFTAEFARVLKPGGKLIVEFKSPFYGLFLALLRYCRRLRIIPRKCFSPGQGRQLFRGYRKGRAVGIGFPFLSGLTRIFGNDAMMNISLVLGRIPIIQFLYYAIVLEHYNEKQN